MTTWQLLAPIWFLEIVVLGHPCSDAGCCEVARWTVHFPAGAIPKCEGHREAWATIYSRAGWHLSWTPLAVRDWPEPDPSALRFAAMELE